MKSSYNNKNRYNEDIRGAEHYCVAANAMVVGSIPTRMTDNAKTRHYVSPLNTQCYKKFDVKWGTECLNTSFLLPTLLKAKKKNILSKFMIIKWTQNFS